MNRRALALLAVALFQYSTAAATPIQWNGTYTNSAVVEDFVHFETDTVLDLNVVGIHTFTNGSAFGSFEWSGVLTPTGPDTASLAGSGMIHNLGDRPFIITSGGLYLDDAAHRYTLYWGATDPMFGPIGWVTYMAETVPEPSSSALLGFGFAALGFMTWSKARIGKRASCAKGTPQRIRLL